MIGNSESTLNGSNRSHKDIRDDYESYLKSRLAGLAITPYSAWSQYCSVSCRNLMLTITALPANASITNWGLENRFAGKRAF